MKRTAVLVSLGSAAPGEALLAGVRSLREAGLSVTLVSRVPPVEALSGAVTGRIAVGCPRGAPIVLGKVKVDPQRLVGAALVVFGRATRDLVRSAELLVAVDAAALPAVWLAARLNRGSVAVNGLPAAVNRI